MAGEHSPSRRTFLAGASVAAMLAAHDQIALALPRLAGAAFESRRDEPLITSLRLRTAAPLAKMKAFYAGTLGLGVVRETDDELTIRAGLTTITFVASPPEAGRPFYHFAFNIPEQKILAARGWQSDRSSLFETPQNLRDPKYPNDVRHFRNWNAHSVFFFDPAENVLEFIARHDLPSTRDRGSSGTGFDTSDILYASEIAFVVDDVPETAQGFARKFDVPEYRRGSEQFQAMGDERGLLLVFKNGRSLGAGSGKPKRGDVFPTEVKIHGVTETAWDFEGYPYRVEAT